MDTRYFNTPAPAFSAFRELMETWDKHCLLQEKRDEINNMLNSHGMSLFFKHSGNIFGAPEDGRIIFAKLKSDEEEEPGFKDQAHFIAMNLLKSMMGEDPSESMFSLKDIPQIQVCDRDEVVEKILNHKEKPKKKK